MHLFLLEASTALNSNDIDEVKAFVEEWIPKINNAIEELRNRASLLELQLAEAEEKVAELEGG
jgi:hypothetical protein